MWDFKKIKMMLLGLIILTLASCTSTVAKRTTEVVDPVLVNIGYIPTITVYTYEF